MAKWMMYSKKADFKEMARTYGIDQVLARILVNRGLTEPEEIRAYLHPRLEDLHDGGQMKDMDRAVALLQEAVTEGRKIRIIGDYDIDGIQATYILHTGLQRAGARVDYAIPHRITDGYGVNPDMIKKCAEDGVELVVTCDNGIAATEAISLAKELGMTILVTDHHEVPFQWQGEEKVDVLVPADAVVDPKRQDCPYPCKKLCGAAVAWKVLLQCYQALGIAQEEGMVFLENVAFATIGDVMELVEENRTIVSLGLQRLRATTNLGMQSLIRRCGLDQEMLSVYHIGFLLGPCLNASGRLDTATQALALLETANVAEAVHLADTLHTLNEERKTMTERGVAAGISYIEEHGLCEDTILVVYLPEIHESIAGIIAGRLRERYAHPVFVLTDAEAEGELKGSGRSMEGYHMYEGLCRCKDFLLRFGGHPMAAGLSMKKEALESFRRKLNEDTTITIQDLEPVISIDAAMPFDYITRELVHDLEKLEPMGNGNAKPIFAQKDVTVVRQVAIGKDKHFRKLTVRDTLGGEITALYFGDPLLLDHIIEERGSFHMTYYPQVNAYRGHESLQVVIGDIC